MRRADLLVVVLLLALGAFIAYQALSVPRPVSPGPGVVAAGGAEAAQAPPGTNVVVSSASLPAPARDVDAIRRHLLARQSGTFVGEILAHRDSNLARWIDRRDKPVRVWIDERSPLAGPDQALASNVRRAFADWGLAGVPLTFTYVGDSAGADVKVTFVDHFEQTMSGRTLWTRDVHWWILGGDIQLSLRNSAGHLLLPDQLYAIALHEVGHLLGLDHTADTLALMAPRVRTHGLTSADVATMRLIYELPPGSVKRRN